jgi:general secretion pathway protein C
MLLLGCEVDVVVHGAKILFFGARLLLFTLFSYFCALAVNSVVAMWLTLPPTALLQDDTSSAHTTPPKPPLASYAVVYTRDIFNSVKAPPQSQAEPTVVAGNNGSLKLWGTALGDNQRAFAIIEDVGAHAQGLYHEGEIILPGVMLVEVRWDRAVIERNGRRETLTLPTMPPSVNSPLPLMATALPPSEGQETIRQMAQDSFQIDRREVDHAMNNLNELFTQARAVPYTSPEGDAQGFRLFSIKPQSLVDRIGLKNGDIVQRVNGVEISDPTTAFGLLQELQGHSQVRVDVLRNHQPVTLSYDIQ